MKKKKTNYNPLCYTLLVILIILLLLPVTLRKFGKNLYKKEVKEKDVIEVMSCAKEGETISSTFLNSEPQNIAYKINGQHSLNLVDDANELINNSNNIISIIRDYALIDYSNDTNITTYSVEIKRLQQSEKYVGIFNNLNNQKKYFESQAFYCVITTY